MKILHNPLWSKWTLADVDEVCFMQYMWLTPYPWCQSVGLQSGSVFVAQIWWDGHLSMGMIHARPSMISLSTSWLWGFCVGAQVGASRAGLWTRVLNSSKVCLAGLSILIHVVFTFLRFLLLLVSKVWASFWNSNVHLGELENMYKEDATCSFYLETRGMRNRV